MHLMSELQHHLCLAVEMTRRQLAHFTVISTWDLNYTLIRAVTNQFFTAQLVVSKIEIENLGSQFYRVSVNNYAKEIFQIQIPIGS